MPFAVTPKYDCPHLVERSYILINMTKQEEKQQPPCVDCGQTQENWICAHENCQYVSALFQWLRYIYSIRLDALVINKSTC
jgi:hypothetical protein